MAPQRPLLRTQVSYLSLWTPIEGIHLITTWGILELKQDHLGLCMCL